MRRQALRLKLGSSVSPGPDRELSDRSAIGYTNCAHRTIPMNFNSSHSTRGFQTQSQLQSPSQRLDRQISSSSRRCTIINFQFSSSSSSSSSSDFMSLKNIFLAKPSDIKFRYFLVGFPAMIHIVTDSSGLFMDGRRKNRKLLRRVPEVCFVTLPRSSLAWRERKMDRNQFRFAIVSKRKRSTDSVKTTNPIFGLMTNFIFSQFSGDAHKRG